jgi:hypothetical protein
LQCNSIAACTVVASFLFLIVELNPHRNIEQKQGRRNGAAVRWL